jgi:hypothetical protein
MKNKATDKIGVAAFDTEARIAECVERLKDEPPLTGSVAFEGLLKAGGDEGIAEFIQSEATRVAGRSACGLENRGLDDRLSRSMFGRDIATSAASAAVQNEEGQVMDVNTRLRYRWEDGIKAWREYVKEMRTCRVSSVSEVTEMEKLLDRLLNKADKVNALVTSLNKLADAISDPRLKEVLK